MPFDEIFKNEPDILLDKDYISKRQAEEYLLKWGGMPALPSLDHDERWKWLKDYEHTYLERDLTDLARINDLIPIRMPILFLLFFTR